jgi:hypothetical protein
LKEHDRGPHTQIFSENEYRKHGRTNFEPRVWVNKTRGYIIDTERLTLPGGKVAVPTGIF